MVSTDRTIKANECIFDFWRRSQNLMISDYQLTGFNKFVKAISSRNELFNREGGEVFPFDYWIFLIIGDFQIIYSSHTFLKNHMSSYKWLADNTCIYRAIYTI